MDPFTQRLRRRNFCRRLQTFYSKKKTPLPSNSTTKETIISESEVIIGCAIKSEVINPDLALETTRVMDLFLHKALGSTLLHCYKDINETMTNSSDKQCSGISSPNECNIEKVKVEIPFHTLNDYRAMTRAKRKSRPPVPSIHFYVHELKHLETEKTLKKVETLQNEIDSQKNILHQVSKALTHCCSSENTKTSTERVEGERLLLLATHRYTAISKKIELLKNDIKNGCPLKAEKGTVHISNLSLTFTEPIYAQTSYEESYTWIVCLLCYEETVIATEAKLLKKDLTLKFRDTFTFNDLLNDFNINVHVFGLSLKRGSNTPKHYFKKLLPKISTNGVRRRHNHGIELPILARMAIFKTPDFQLMGSFSIGLDDLNEYLTWSKFPRGQIQITLNWDVISKVETSGFLTVGESNGEYYTWERRWCFLEECKLKYWNYPADREHMSPLGILDLRQCICSSVKPLDKAACSKPRTFELELVQIQKEGSEINDSKNPKSFKYLFSTDTSEDLSQWCMVLSKNLELLQKWKKIN